MTEARLAESHRLAQATLSQTVAVDVQRIMQQLDLQSLDRSFGAYSKTMQALVSERRGQSQALANNYYLNARAESGSGLDFEPVAIQPLDVDALQTSLVVTGPAMGKRAIGAGLTVPEIKDRITVATTKSMQRHVLNAGRDQVKANVLADSKAGGWMRITDGRPCPFCAMLASRGPVYKSQTSAGGFGHRFHDGCGCSIVSIFEASGPQLDDWKHYNSLWYQAKALGSQHGVAGEHVFDYMVKGLDPSQAVDAVKKYNESGWAERLRLERARQAEEARQRALLRKQTYRDRMKMDPEFAKAERERYLKNLGDKAKPKAAKSAAVVPVDDVFTRNGYRAKQEWPKWARDSKLDELLARLPDDRTTFGMAPEFTAPDITDAQALQMSRDERAQKLKFKDWADFEDKAAKAEKRLPKLQAKADEARAAYNEFEQRLKTDFTMSHRDGRDLWDAKWKAEQALSKAEEVIDDFANWTNRMQAGTSWVKTPEQWQRELAGNAFKWEVDATGLPIGKYADGLDAMQEIGSVVTKEVDRRWAALYPDIESPLSDITGQLKRVEAQKAALKAEAEAVYAKMRAVEMGSEEYNTLRQQWYALLAKRPEALYTEAQLTEYSQLTRTVISEVRPMATRDMAAQAMVQSTRGMAAEGAIVMEESREAMTYFPETWGKAFVDSVGGRPYQVGVISRGHNSFHARELYVSGSGAQRMATMVHEIGHGFETAMPHLGRAEFGLLSRRALRQKNASKWAALKHIDGDTRDAKYQPNTGFRAQYSARIYSGNGWDWLASSAKDRPWSFEVFTTGTQVVFPRVATDITRYGDSEFRDMMLGMMVGL